MRQRTAKRTALGIELGSTRIKAVLTDERGKVLASGAYDWENDFENGYWTYPLDKVWEGIRCTYARLAEAYRENYGDALCRVDVLGVSGMMHGYLPFDRQGNQLAAFRTWRNTTTGQAAELLTARFGFNIPQRWSIAHLYQAMLNQEEHVGRIAYLTTLAGYVHWQLTGRKAMGIGEASGMFPIDSRNCDFDHHMVESFDELLAEAGLPYRLREILPEVMTAGAQAGVLTEAGARLLDPSGVLQPGIPVCPPEGDAGTGMAATNSVAARTGNVSAGTSVFAMIVLEKALSRVYPEIDLVTTPSGRPVAMVHCNTCTSDLDAWVKLLGEMADMLNVRLTKTQLYELFYQKALEADPDCGGLINFNYFSGEPVAGVSDGRPLFLRRPGARLNLANFARAQIYSAMATLKLGMDLLFDQEQVALDKLLGHGGLFKTPVVGQKLLAGALGVPVSVMETASEGGPWGMALLALYSLNCQNREGERPAGESLEAFLDQVIFQEAQGSLQQPEPADIEGFAAFMKDYIGCIPVERAAADTLK